MTEHKRVRIDRSQLKKLTIADPVEKVLHAKSAHEALGVSKQSTPKEVKKGYRTTVSKIHPDTNHHAKVGQAIEIVNNIMDVSEKPGRYKTEEAKLQEMFTENTRAYQQRRAPMRSIAARVAHEIHQKKTEKIVQQEIGQKALEAEAYATKRRRFADEGYSRHAAIDINKSYVSEETRQEQAERLSNILREQPELWDKSVGGEKGFLVKDMVFQAIHDPHTSTPAVQQLYAQFLAEADPFRQGVSIDQQMQIMTETVSKKHPHLFFQIADSAIRMNPRLADSFAVGIMGAVRAAVIQKLPAHPIVRTFVNVASDKGLIAARKAGIQWMYETAERHGDIAARYAPAVERIVNKKPELCTEVGDHIISGISRTFSGIPEVESLVRSLRKAKETAAYRPPRPAERAAAPGPS